MYSFEPTEEQQMLIDAIKRYATNDLRPKTRDAEEENQLPENLIEKGWELGFLQASIPEQYGGFGERSAVTGVLAAEEMAYGDLAGALAVMTPGLFAMPILLAGQRGAETDLPAGHRRGSLGALYGGVDRAMLRFRSQRAAHDGGRGRSRLRFERGEDFRAVCGSRLRR